MATLKAYADLTFDEFDPPIGGLRTWPIIRTPATAEGDSDRITHFTNLKAEPGRRYKQAAYDRVTSDTRYGGLLATARHQGADHTIYAYSTSGYRQRRDAMEVAWGSHKYRLMTKAHKRRFPTCAKCGHKLTHSHLLGGCFSTSRLRISRHHSTFTLLHQLLTQENGGRWPILAMDLGIQPTRDFNQQLETCRADTLPAPDCSPDSEQDPDTKPDSHYSTSIPAYLLPTQYRPEHYKPDIVRAVGYYLDQDTKALIPDPEFQGRRTLQLIECKYATDTNMHESTRP